MTERSLSSSGISLCSLLADELPRGMLRDVRAASCTSDWRQVRTGDVFVALGDTEEDGHDQAAEAARRGAAAVIAERPLPIFDVPQFVVADSRAVYGRLCQALVGNPSQQLKLIGVTGTHGKTTVARLIAAIFRAVGANVATLDSFGYRDRCQKRPAVDGPLSAPQLAASLGEMVAAGASHGIVELSSRELSQRILAGIGLDAVCVTHVSGKHLDWHGSVENYRQATRRVFEHLDAAGVAVLNADDPVSVRMLCDLANPALTFGMRQPAEITADIVEQHINEQTFLLTAGDETVSVRTEIIGDHHVYNCLAAATLCIAYGVPLTAVARGLESIVRLPGRMERIACGQEFAVLVDAARTPDALRAVLRAARQATVGRVICAFTADGAGIDQLPAAGRVVGAMADTAVITKDPRDANSLAACYAAQRGFADPRKAQIIVDRKEAIASVIAEARPGDAVVVAGLGEKSFRTNADGRTLCDAEIVRQVLQTAQQTVSRQRTAA